jgi:hypothetical protein
MKIISHRGNLYGQDASRENNIWAIDECISLGFDVEIDLWVEDALYLGHDRPEHAIKQEYLINLANNLWIHAKNIKAVEWLSDIKELNWFWHQTDTMTLTSKGIPWCYPGHYVSTGITVELGYQSMLPKLYGVCTDYPLKWKNWR